MRPSLVVAFSLSLMACDWGGDPWKIKGAPSRPPEEQYRSGPAEAGTDVYIWQCEGGSRIRVSKSGTWFFGGPARLQRVPCGSSFPYEQDAGVERRNEIPACCRWPGSPPPKPDARDIVDAGAD